MITTEFRIPQDPFKGPYTPQLGSLPKEILLTIFSQLTIITLRDTVCLVNRRFCILGQSFMRQEMTKWLIEKIKFCDQLVPANECPLFHLKLRNLIREILPAQCHLVAFLIT